MLIPRLEGFKAWRAQRWSEEEKVAKEKGVEAVKDMVMKNPYFLKLALEKPDVAVRLKQMISD